MRWPAGTETPAVSRKHKIRKVAFNLGKLCTKVLIWAGVILGILLMLIVLAVKYAVMPNIERYQNDIISKVASSTGMDVSAKTIRGGWAGFRPYIELEDVVFREQAETASSRRAAGEEALRLPELRASLSWWSLLIGQVRLADVRLMGPALSLSREADGLIYFAGSPINKPNQVEDDGRFLRTLLDQPGLSIHHATLSWHDALTPAAELKFTDVGISLDKGLTGHSIGFVATPPRALARKIELRGLVNLKNDENRWKVNGSLYLAADDASLTELRKHLTIPDPLQTGVGNVRAWVDIDSTVAPPPGTSNRAMLAFNPVRAITADVYLINTRVQLGEDVAPLQIAKLAGRLEYKASQAGFTIASKALEFRTREGVVSPPADFSLTLQNQADAAGASGEITANGIDLKAMSALINFFPIGKDMRALGERFAMRGMVQQSRFAWTGYLDKPLTYQIRGKLAEFGSNTSEAIPGISGFTGTVEGDDKGGRFTVASKNLVLDVPRVMPAPLQFLQFESGGEWKVTPDTVEVSINGARFANNDLAGELDGRYWRYRASGSKAAEEKGPGSLDVKLRVTGLKATTMPGYLPVGAVKTRDYLQWALRDGEIVSTNVEWKGPIYDFPYREQTTGSFRIDAKVKAVDYRYLEGWPVANDVDGEILFENTRFEAKLDTGKFFNAVLNKTTIAVDDFGGSPPMLTIQGSSDARAEEMSRYLKESPLINSVGAFTRFVALDGPGKLELGLKIPLGEYDRNRFQTRINGKYSLARGHAKLAFGPELFGLGGSIAFSEANVRSSNLVATAYGNPMTINIAGTGDSGVAVDFTARADVAQLSDVLPFRMPQQVKGIADFTGRVFAKGGSTEVTIESALSGITSTLPAPLAIRAEESRRLKVQFSNTGLPTEKIRVTLAGNSQGAAQSSDSPESRIDARFQRSFDAAGQPKGFFGGVASVGDALGEVTIPEGMWLAGTLPRFDFDAWRAAVDTFYPVLPGATADAGAKAESPIAGFDFKLGGMLAYGRPFKAMTLKGRHGSEGWRMTMDSAEASGDFTWRPAAFNDRGLVRARLQRFVLAEESPAIGGTPAADGTAEADLPALDIVAEKFTLKDRELGKLELRATPQGANWKIDQLNISNGHLKLETDGLWQRFGDPQKPDGRSRTTMNVRFETANLNATFDQFGYGDYLKGGRGKLEGQLSWPGHSYQYNASSLSGHFKVAANNGRFSKIEPGAGKLLGLISLQALPRRITLDFRDIFSEGFAFDKIEGDIKINNGIMFTDNFEIKGPAADIKMVGDISLPAEKQNLTMTVVPSLGEGVAIGAAVLLTPAVGAGVLLAQKMLQGANTYDYSVTGSWDNPVVEKIKQTPPPQQQAGVPATSTTSPTAAGAGKAADPAKKSP